MGKGIGETLNGEKIEAILVSYHPIELKYPYSEDELAEKIKQGIEYWCKFPAYDNFFWKKYI